MIKMSVDDDYIRKKFFSIRKHVERIKVLINLPIKEIEDELDNQVKAERYFEIIAQSIIDICTHIVSRKSVNIPQTYADCMKELAKLKIITNTLAERLSQMVKMRNLVVHQYEIIDHELVINSLRELLDDLKLYKGAIFQWMDNDH